MNFFFYKVLNIILNTNSTVTHNAIPFSVYFCFLLKTSIMVYKKLLNSLWKLEKRLEITQTLVSSPFDRLVLLFNLVVHRKVMLLKLNLKIQTHLFHSEQYRCDAFLKSTVSSFMELLCMFLPKREQFKEHLFRNR